MNELNIKLGRDLGKSNPYEKYISCICELCEQQRWVPYRKSLQPGRLCKSCVSHARGKLNRAWKGGRRVNNYGYIEIKLTPDDFFYSMTGKDSYVFEHRLVMARHLGRCLHRWEIIHHKNHIRGDNGLKNLQLYSDNKHKQLTILENRIMYLEKRVTLLEAENIVLKSNEVFYPTGGKK